MTKISKLFLALICCLPLSCSPQPADVPLSPEGKAAYHAHLTRATTLVEQGKVVEAEAEVKAARTLNPKGYEAPATLALILQTAGQPQEAAAAIAEAQKLAPAEARHRLDAIAKMVGPPAATTPTQKPATASVEAAGKKPSNVMTGAARRKFDTLLVIVGEADQAKSATERKKLLEEFLTKSAEFVGEYPDVLAVWVLRAGAALELEQEQTTWMASSEMMRLGAEDMDDPKIRQLLAKMDRKGWLRTPQQMAEMKAEEERRVAEAKAAEERRQAEAKAEEKRRQATVKAAQEKWQVMKEKGGENFLGMKFVPVPGTEVLFCVWETRVKDYRAYAQANGAADGSWQKPGFEQGADHPVVNVNWEDAKAFCAWLSQKDGMNYRLPTDAEWSYAVGIGDREGGGSPMDKDMKIPGVYPWGTQYPPPQGAGNYGYSLKVDSYDKTAPVGSFSANSMGLYDLSGNIWERCDGNIDSGAENSVLRGGSWNVNDPRFLLSSDRVSYTPGNRLYDIGFRVVLVSVSVR